MSYALQVKEMFKPKQSEAKRFEMLAIKKRLEEMN